MPCQSMPYTLYRRDWWDSSCWKHKLYISIEHQHITHLWWKKIEHQHNAYISHFDRICCKAFAVRWQSIRRLPVTRTPSELKMAKWKNKCVSGNVWHTFQWMIVATTSFQSLWRRKHNIGKHFSVSVAFYDPLAFSLWQ
jgi:hypothetical protein